MSSISIFQGSCSINDNPDVSKNDPGSLTISKFISCGSTGTFGTSVSVGTNLTVGNVMSGANLTLTSSTLTNTIAGPLSLQSPTTSNSTGTFTTLTTTATAAANTFANPSTFNAAISGTTGNFSGGLTASNFTGTSSTLTSTLQGPLNVVGTTNHVAAVTFGSQLNYPNTYYSITAQSSLPVSQGGTGIPGNVWRYRTNDAVNTGARMSLGNAGMGNNYYDSQYSVYGLGVIEGTTGNTERLTLGYNGLSGPFLNQIATGTGISRPLNIYNGAIFTTGGALTLAATLGITGQTTFGAQCNYPNNYYTYTQNLPGTGNTFRFRSTDATNTTLINSLANTGVSSTTAYTSLMAFYSLGNTELNTTNTELMYIGNSGTGAFITPASAGTGVTTKPINVYGSTFVNNGLVTLPQGLTVTSGTTTLGGTLNLTNTTDLTALTLAGGATFAKSVLVGGEITIGTNATSVIAASNPLSSSLGVLFTSSTVTWNDTMTAASKSASGNFYGNFLGASTLTATNTAVTTPLAATLYIAGAPIASTNQTITAAYSAYLASGNVFIGAATNASTSTSGALVVAGGAGFGGNVVLNGTLACTNIQDFGTLSVQGAATLSSTLNLAYLPTQPATPASGDTFFVNSTGLLQSVGPDGVLTTFQPLTTSGDLLVHNGVTQTRLAKGADSNTLIADSTAAVGVSWQPNTRMLIYNGNTATVPAPKWAVKFYTGTSAAATGQILVYPTTNATSSGAKVFSTIVHVSVYVQG